MRYPAAGRALFAENAARRSLRAAGFAALGLMTVLLYALSARQAWQAHAAGGAALTLLLLLLLWAIGHELPDLSAPPPPGAPAPGAALRNMAGVVGGGMTTYWLSHRLALGPVTAAGAVGLAGALLLSAQAAPIYCGAFVGMVCPMVFGCPSHVLLASGIGAIVYVLSAGTLNGFGGKLGTIAFIGTAASGVGLRRTFSAPEIPPLSLALPLLLCGAGAAVATYWISVEGKRGPVLGSSLVGLLCGLLLPVLLPENGPLLAVMAICASFTGMSSPARIPGPWWMMLAGAATALVFIYSLPVLGGAGGKLGTIAFGASMAVFCLGRLLSPRARRAGGG